MGLVGSYMADGDQKRKEFSLIVRTKMGMGVLVPGLSHFAFSLSMNGPALLYSVGINGDEMMPRGSRG